MTALLFIVWIAQVLVAYAVLFFVQLPLIYRLMGRDTYGSYRHGDTELYVTPGIGGWMYPFRSEASCRYELVTLTPSLYR